MKNPLVSICLPVRNSKDNKNSQNITIEKVLNNLVNQTYKNIEIIISDNCSEDGTFEIIKKFEKKYNFIHIFRQEKKISWAENFEFTQSKAKGDYFKWNACDDLISLDFIEKNVKFLEKNHDYTFSSSKSFFETSMINPNKIILDGNLYERIKFFFKVRSICHNVFYSLIRTKSFKNVTSISYDYLGIDWIVCLDLLFLGKFRTIDDGYMIFGTNGMSKKKRFVDRDSYTKKVIYNFFPFFELSKILIFKSLKANDLSFFQKIHIIIINLKLNFYFILKYRL